MGDRIFTRSLYSSALAAHDCGELNDKGEYVATTGVTRFAEQKARNTGKLDQLVDPSGFGVIRLSLPRVEKMEDGRYKLLVGTPMPIETRVDTTGSMGGNVDIAMKVLPDAFEQWQTVLEGYDIQVATGIFGDVSDPFPLCRPQFEMDPDKIIKQLSLMVPERAGGDLPEDPDLGIFGGAYFCRHYINRIGLKGYDFTVTDAPGRGQISERQLVRVYGEKFLDKIKENGLQFNSRNGIDLNDVWAVLLDRAHAFVIQVGNNSMTRRFWDRYTSSDRVVSIPDVHYLPHAQAAIIGVTEGSLVLNEVADFLVRSNMPKSMSELVANEISKIPVAAQASLPNFSKRPMKGDIFADKPDVWEDKNLWPVGDSDEVLPSGESALAGEDGEESEWL